MKEFFKEWNPRNNSIILIGIANDIINEYQSEGYILTLRQLYYTEYYMRRYHNYILFRHGKYRKSC